MVYARRVMSGARPPSRRDRVLQLLHAEEARGRVRWYDRRGRYEAVPRADADADARADAETVAALATLLRQRYA